MDEAALCEMMYAKIYEAAILLVRALTLRNFFAACPLTRAGLLVRESLKINDTNAGMALMMQASDQDSYYSMFL